MTLRRMFAAAAVVLACAAPIAGCRKSALPPPSAQETQEFGEALKDGDAVIVDRLLSAKPALANADMGGGTTPLKLAVQASNDELAQVIRRHGGHE